MIALTVRDAGQADARAIATVHVRAWRAAYRRLLPAKVLAGLSVDAREGNWCNVLGRAATDSFTLVAVGAEQRVAGFCTVVAPTRDEDADERTAEIAATYVDPQQWRTGVGSALLEAALSRLRQRGWQDVTLWVFSMNDTARAFYATFDFELDGAEATQEWAGGQAASRMRARLG